MCTVAPYVLSSKRRDTIYCLRAGIKVKASCLVKPIISGTLLNFPRCLGSRGLSGITPPGPSMMGANPIQKYPDCESKKGTHTIKPFITQSICSITSRRGIYTHIIECEVKHNGASEVSSAVSGLQLYWLVVLQLFTRRQHFLLKRLLCAILC